MTEKMIQKNFKRTELKYVIDHDIYQKLSEAFKDHLVADEFAQSTITNIYFDTSDFQMIQNAIAKKGGREKVRMRTYQAKPTPTSQVKLSSKLRRKLTILAINSELRLKLVRFLKLLRPLKPLNTLATPSWLTNSIGSIKFTSNCSP